MAKIITISGPIGSGKDEFTKRLQKQLQAKGKSVEIDRFAGLLKEICRDLGIDPDNRETKEVKVELSDAMFSGIVSGVFDALTKVLPPHMANPCHLAVGYLLADAAEQGGLSPRDIQRAIGNGVRKVNPDFWIYIVELRASVSEADYVIIPDCRFIKELAIADISIYMSRPNNPYTSTDDISESELTLIRSRSEYVVGNFGKLYDLSREARNIANSIINNLE